MYINWPTIQVVMDVKLVDFKNLSHYESVTTHFTTLVTKLHGMKAFKSSADNKATAFCDLVRKIAKQLIIKTVPSKSKLCAEFRVKARVYNLAFAEAKSAVVSATESHEQHREITSIKLDSAIKAYLLVEAKGVLPVELRQRKRKIERYNTKFTNFAANPSMFIFGKKLYYEQHKYKDKLVELTGIAPA